MVVNGERAARRIGALLAEVVAPAFEVGPGGSGLPAQQEVPPGGGPLAALASGWHALIGAGHRGDALVVACDLPFVTAELLGWLACRPGRASIVPIVDGRPQPLCARWSARDLARTAELVADGHRSFTAVYDECDVSYVSEDEWGSVADARAFADTDSVADLQRLGVTWTVNDD